MKCNILTASNAALLILVAFFELAHMVDATHLLGVVNVIPAGRSPDKLLKGAFFEKIPWEFH